jgi:hypothetical protein
LEFSETVTKTKTITGRDALIYNTHGGVGYPIHGAYWGGDAEGWILSAWLATGRKFEEVRTDLDLTIIEDSISEKQS